MPLQKDWELKVEILGAVIKGAILAFEESTEITVDSVSIMHKSLELSVCVTVDL